MTYKNELRKVTYDELIHEINSLARDIDAYANSPFPPAPHAVKDGINMYRMAVQELNRRDKQNK